MKLLIVLRHPFELWNSPSWLSARIGADFPTVEAVQRASYDDIEKYLRDAEVVIAWSLRPEQLQAAEKLRWIHSPAAAVHQLLFPELVNRDIILTKSSEVHGGVVAEHVLALVFALAKRLPQAARFQQKHVWGQEALWLGHPRPREIAGATLGLIGLGGIGRRVAKSAAGLGMRVIAVRQHPEKEIPEGVEHVYATWQVEELLSQSDYVVLATPVTPSTVGLMNAARLAKMKPDAYLINVGRGPLLDETALAKALHEHILGGAALDVFGEEPIAPDSPLWDLENLFITPHTAGITEKLWERHYAFISENLCRYLAQRPLLGVVDKKEGY
jgi:phosphoglycerate dehydrogenase-like enzyme